MNFAIYCVYVTIVGLIRVIKWIELRVLLLLTPFLKRKAKTVAARIGLVLHCPGDDTNQNSSLSAEKEQLILEKCKGKYDNLIHIKGNDDSYFAKICNLGTLGLGEAFMEKAWDAYGENWEDVTEVATRALENNLLDLFYRWPTNCFYEWLELHAFNLQTRKKAFEVGKVHYDLGKYLAIIKQRFSQLH